MARQPIIVPGQEKKQTPGPFKSSQINISKDKVKRIDAAIKELVRQGKKEEGFAVTERKCKKIYKIMLLLVVICLFLNCTK